MTSPTKGLVERLEEKAALYGKRPDDDNCYVSSVALHRDYSEAGTALGELTQGLDDALHFCRQVEQNTKTLNEFNELPEISRLSNLLSKYQPEDK